MNKRTLLNLALAGIAVLLILVIVYRPGKELPPVPASLTNIDADTINTVRITRKEHKSLTFRKKDDTWYLVVEQTLPASKFQLRALLKLLSARPERSYPVSDIELASAGLNPPQARLMLGDTRIDIGTTEPLEKKRYIRYGDTVYLLTDKYQHLINADWTNFVERRLLPEQDTLTAVHLPGDPDIDDAAMQELLAQWQAATATYVRRYEGKSTGESITLELADGNEDITLYVVEQQPELVLARPYWNIEYHFPGQMRTTLLALPAVEPDAEIEIDTTANKPAANTQ